MGAKPYSIVPKEVIVLRIIQTVLSQNFQMSWSFSCSHCSTSFPGRHSPYLRAFEMLYLHFDATRGSDKDNRGGGKGVPRDGRQKCIFARNPCTYCNCWLTWRHLAAADNLCASAGCLSPLKPPLWPPPLPTALSVSYRYVWPATWPAGFPCACHQVGLKWQSRFNGAESVSEGVPGRPSPAYPHLSSTSQPPNRFEPKYIYTEWIINRFQFN